MAVYQPGIPTGTVELDEDYLNVQGNFQQANVVYGEDHYPFDNASANQGFHSKVTMPNSSPAPTSIASQGIVYTQDRALVPGTTDLYYAYQTSGGTDFTGFLFPLTAVRAFGKVKDSGPALVSGSFNVSSASLSTNTWTVGFSTHITSAPNLSRILVLLGGESTAATEVLTYELVDTLTIRIRRTGSTISNASFWVVAI